jgi:glycosyltransferase involved in cell wall biosynthesis
MACGIPVVASAVGGLAETIVDGRTGILVPPRQSRSIRAAITTLLGDPSRRRAMRNAALRRASRYAWPAIAGRTLDIATRMHAQGRVSPAEGPLPAVAWTIGAGGGAG